MKKMLDLFSGAGGASQAMEEDDNWEVTTVDFDERFEPDICADVLDLTPNHFDGHYDLVWASPPCNKFSVATIYQNWRKEDGLLIPQNEETIDKIKLVYKTLEIMGGIDKEWWFLENPRALLRKIIGEPQGTVTYCQYGATYMKPTDLWGRHPPSFEYKSCSAGDDCHESSPRGSDKGTQGLDKKTAYFDLKEELGKDGARRVASAIRAKVPYGLSQAVKKSVENPEPPRNRLEAFV